MLPFMLYIQVSKINREEEVGVIPKSSEGKVEFKDVDFRYPSRQDVQIMKGSYLTNSLFYK